MSVKDVRAANSGMGPFGELVAKAEDLQVVASKLEATILASFGLDRALGIRSEMTDTEIKRRFNICEKWFRTMRADLHYSLQRTLDTIPHALKCELFGLPFDPEENLQHGWSPKALDIDNIPGIIGPKANDHE